MEPITQQTGAPVPETERTHLIPAMARGFMNRCPHCGQGRMFGRFLKVNPECDHCGLAMHVHRADDLPPYIVIFLVGHIVGYMILETEMNYDVPLWISLAVWPTLTLVLAAGLLQPVKGAVVGLQYAFGMHGFGLPAPLAGMAADGEDASRGGPAGSDSPSPGPAPGFGRARA